MSFYIYAFFYGYVSLLKSFLRPQIDDFSDFYNYVDIFIN